MSEILKNIKIMKEKDGDVEKSVANSLNTLMDYLGETTEYKRNELFAISLFQAEDKYLFNMLKFYVQNKRHLKRKFSKEVRETIGVISKAVASEYQSKKFMSFLRRSNNQQNDNW